MNKKLVTVMLAIAIVVATFAQEGAGGNRGGGRGFGGMQRTVAERVAFVHTKFDSTFHFGADKQAKVDTAFAEQYRAQDVARAEAFAVMNNQQPDPEVMKAARDKIQEKMKELQIARDEKLQTILTDVEYKKWKDELEPSLRPQRGQGGGRGGDGNRGGNGGGQSGNGVKEGNRN